MFHFRLSWNFINSYMMMWSSANYFEDTVYQILAESCPFENFHKLFAVVAVQIFNATRHPRHIEAAAIATIYMYLYSLAFMDHPCTLGAAVCHQAPPCPLYTQPRARPIWARRNSGLKIVSSRAGFEPMISCLKVECANHLATQPTLFAVFFFFFFRFLTLPGTRGTQRQPQKNLD